MKRSPDYYHNRKMLRELKYADELYRPTIVEIRMWFDILNEQIFGNKLPPFTKIILKKLTRHNVHAFYHYGPKKEKEYTVLEMDRMFRDEKFFVEILAHEMVHHFQYSYNEPLGHGPTFLAWRENLKLRGLTLYKAA